jgi:diguanylate cyclase/phosphodiesterase
MDIQALICAALIFTTAFYYPMRMIVCPRYARVFWLRHCQPWLVKEKRTFTLYWFTVLTTIMLVLCAPYDSDLIAGYLVPIIFILYFIGIGRLGYELIRITWAISAFFLVAYNKIFFRAFNRGIPYHLFCQC